MELPLRLLVSFQMPIRWRRLLLKLHLLLCLLLLLRAAACRTAARGAVRGSSRRGRGGRRGAVGIVCRVVQRGLCTCVAGRRGGTCGRAAVGTASQRMQRVQRVGEMPGTAPASCQLPQDGLRPGNGPSSRNRLPHLARQLLRAPRPLPARRACPCRTGPAAAAARVREPKTLTKTW